MRRATTLLSLIAGFTVCTSANAHGGLSMDQDTCKLAVGPYRMHFAGYQEKAQRTEFCEDIPATGRTVVVLDFVDDALRDMPVEVKVIRRTGESMTEGTLMYALAPKVYPRGTLTLTHDFREAGDYVGLVWAGERREAAAVFPFSVGRDASPAWMSGGALALVVLGGTAFVVARQRLADAVGQSHARGEGPSA